MEDPSSPQKPVTAKRQKILADAFAELRKARKQMDPGILSKIREIVRNSPVLMKKLGISVSAKADENMLLSGSAKKQPNTVSEKQKTQEKYEKIDQAKNMEIMAKLMELKPSGRDDIKSVIKKARDS